MRWDAYWVYYKFIMPIIAVVLLLGVSQVIVRPIFMGSNFLDLATRILLCVWFCIGYINLPNLAEKNRFYPHIKWAKSDISVQEKVIYVVAAISFGIFIIVVTYWIIQVFLPNFEKVGLILSIMNGVVYSFPLVKQYEILKL